MLMLLLEALAGFASVCLPGCVWRAVKWLAALPHLPHLPHLTPMQQQQRAAGHKGAADATIVAATAKAARVVGQV